MHEPNAITNIIHVANCRTNRFICMHAYLAENAHHILVQMHKQFDRCASQKYVKLGKTNRKFRLTNSIGYIVDAFATIAHINTFCPSLNMCM